MFVLFFLHVTSASSKTLCREQDRCRCVRNGLGGIQQTEQFKSEADLIPDSPNKNKSARTPGKAPARNAGADKRSHTRRVVHSSCAVFVLTILNVLLAIGRGRANL